MPRQQLRPKAETWISQQEQIAASFETIQGLIAAAPFSQWWIYPFKPHVQPPLQRRSRRMANPAGEIRHYLHEHPGLDRRSPVLNLDLQSPRSPNALHSLNQGLPQAQATARVDQ
jgi:hypothetical protein